MMEKSRGWQLVQQQIQCCRQYRKRSSKFIKQFHTVMYYILIFNLNFKCASKSKLLHMIRCLYCLCTQISIWFNICVYIQLPMQLWQLLQRVLHYGVLLTDSDLHKRILVLPSPDTRLASYFNALSSGGSQVFLGQITRCCQTL